MAGLPDHFTEPEEEEPTKNESEPEAADHGRAASATFTAVDEAVMLEYEAVHSESRLEKTTREQAGEYKAKESNDMNGEVSSDHPGLQAELATEIPTEETKRTAGRWAEGARSAGRGGQRQHRTGKAGQPGSEKAKQRKPEGVKSTCQKA